MKLLIIHGLKGSVTQADLENVISLDGQIRHLQGVRDRIAAGILDRLNNGAEVETGARAYDIDVSYSGSTRRQKLIVR